MQRPPAHVVSIWAVPDLRLVESFHRHLAPLQRQGIAEVWDERALVAGEDSDQQMQEHLERADVILAFISADFLADSRCVTLLEHALTRHDLSRAVLVPILACPCGWQHSPLQRLQILPIDLRPVVLWPNQDQACQEIISTLRELLRPGTEAPTQHRGERLFRQALDEPAHLVGLKLGNYVLQKKIGQGGSGIVYQAFNQALGQQACIKVLYPIQGNPELVGASMRRAVRCLAGLRHPGLVQIHDCGSIALSDGQSFFLAMELIEGHSFSAWIDRIERNKNAFSLKLQAARRIAESLALVHHASFIDESGFAQTGVCHGDIKPANILVRPDGTPVLVDFMLLDIHRVLDPNAAPASRWDKGPATAAFGTPGYMSPEQERDGICSPLSDVYSLGLTFLALFCPMDPPSLEILFAVMNSESSDWITATHPNLPSENFYYEKLMPFIALPQKLRYLLCCMLAKKMTARPHMDFVASILASLQASEEASLWKTLTGWFRR